MPAITTNDLKNGIPSSSTRPVPGRRVPAREAGQGRRVRAHEAQERRAPAPCVERTFRAGEKVEQAIVDKREMQYLYRDGDDYVFMDNATYDQMHVEPPSRSATPPTTSSSGSTAILQMYGGEIVGVELPGGGRADRSPRPSPACRATGCRAPASRPRWRPASSCRCPLFVEPGDAHQGRHPLRRVPDPGLSP